MIETLKPCPFCGSCNVYLEYWDDEAQTAKWWDEHDDYEGTTFHYVVCKGCESSIVFGGIGTGKQVIKEYNRRAKNES